MMQKVAHWLGLLALTASISAVAADADSALQQQLQNIQQGMNQSTSTPSPANQAPAPNAATEGPAQLGAGGLAASAPTNAQAAPGDAAATTTTTTTVVTNVAPPAAAEPEAAPMSPEEMLRQQAFSRVTANALPLSPAQIQALRTMYDATQQAAAMYPGVPPKPTSTSISVNLSPGATPPVIRLQAGFITSLVFVDAAGEPWPLESYSLGNPQAFNIQWDKRSNILLVQAVAAHRVGNLAVILRGLNTPVMIDLSPGQAATDVRVDLRIPKMGPNAKPTYTNMSALPDKESPYLLNLLDGIPPPGARALKTQGCDDCAWYLDGKLYLRTQYTILSPGWISTLSSADGTHVYEMMPTPLILASFNGKTIRLRIEGF